MFFSGLIMKLNTIELVVVVVVVVVVDCFRGFPSSVAVAL